jgi:Flp pilus assembly protein TadG
MGKIGAAANEPLWARTVLTAFLRHFRGLQKEEDGVVLILVALLIVPLLLVVAVGIDFSQTLVVKRQLAAAVDAAALAIGTDQGEIDQAALDEKAEAYIRAHYSEASFGTLKDFDVTRAVNADSDIEVDVSAVAEVPTSFMRLGGVETLTVAVSSKVIRRDRNLEVVMVLDNSGSMSSAGKMTAMKDAANGLVSTLFGNQETPSNIRVGLVPFTGGVNVNVLSTTPWLDKANPADLNGLILTLLAGESAFDFLAVMRGGIAARWGGCVRSRVGNDPGGPGYDVSDRVPDPTMKNTLFSAYFKPFLGPLKAAYMGVLPPGGPMSPNENCPAAPVQPLTNVKSTITNAINAMTPNGSTNIPEAVAWGWRLISSSEPFTQGAVYSDQNTIKALIVLTDGENAINGSFSSYGQGTAQLNAALNPKMTQVCDNVVADKDGVDGDEDIQLYTIAFNVPPGSTVETLMKNCATKDSYAYSSQDNSSMQSAFRAIAASLNQLRIAK